MSTLISLKKNIGLELKENHCLYSYLESDGKFLKSSFVLCKVKSSPAQAVFGRVDEWLQVKILGEKVVEHRLVHLLSTQQQPVPAQAVVQQQLQISITSLFPFSLFCVKAVQNCTLSEYCNKRVVIYILKANTNYLDML